MFLASAHMYPDLTLIAAGSAGLLSFLSPCILPIVPFYLCYIAGIGMNELSGDGVTPASSAVLFLRHFSLPLAFSQSLSALAQPRPYSVSCCATGLTFCATSRRLSSLCWACILSASSGLTCCCERRGWTVLLLRQGSLVPIWLGWRLPLAGRLVLGRCWQPSCLPLAQVMMFRKACCCCLLMALA